MGRPSKKILDTPTQKVEETNVKQEAPSVTSDETEITPQIDKIMKLYPQYERIYITKEGFVHPYGAPKYLIKGATLYTNKYYKQ